MLNEVQVREKALELKQYLMDPKVKKSLEEVLPKKITADRFVKTVIVAGYKNPKIFECSKESIMICLLQSAQYGLTPMGGRAHLVPYWNGRKKTYEAVFMLGYMGIVDLVRRSGEIVDVYAHVVREKDEFSIQYGLNRDLKHVPCMDDDPGKIIGAYAVWRLKDGSTSFEYMPMREIEKRRESSQAWQWAERGDKSKGGGKKDSPWHLYEDIMCKKTVIKYSAKLLPLGFDVEEAMEKDDEPRLVMPAGDIGNILPEHTEDPVVPGKAENATQNDNLDDRFFLEFRDIISVSGFKPFLQEAAEANGVTEDQVKEEALKTPDNFRAAFDAWSASRKQAQNEDPAPVWDRSNWVKMRGGKPANGTGFAPWVISNLDELRKAPLDIQQELVSKWKKLYGDTAFASEFWTEEPGEDDQGAGQDPQDGGENKLPGTFNKGGAYARPPETENTSQGAESDRFANVPQALQLSAAGQEMIGLVVENKELQDVWDRYLVGHTFETEEDVERVVIYLKGQLQRETLGNQTVKK